MDSVIILSLVQDGLVNGAIYALVAVALVLVFAVTRVILIPQGEFVAFAALTFAQIQQGLKPGTAGLLVVLGIVACALDLIRERKHLSAKIILRRLAIDIAAPLILYGLVAWLAPRQPGTLVAIVLTLLLMAPLGPFIYRIAFRPLADTSVLVLLIAIGGRASGPDRAGSQLLRSRRVPRRTADRCVGRDRRRHHPGAADHRRGPVIGGDAGAVSVL